MPHEPWSLRHETCFRIGLTRGKIRLFGYGLSWCVFGFQLGEPLIEFYHPNTLTARLVMFYAWNAIVPRGQIVKSLNDVYDKDFNDAA